MGQVDFSSERVGRSIVNTTLPMLAAQLISLLYNIVDRIYIGRIPGTGTAALGGVGLCFPVIIMILAFTNLYGFGGSPLCAIERGRGNTAKAERYMNTAFFLLLVTGALIMILGELCAPPLLRLFGADSENIIHGLPYLRIYLLGTIPSMLATGLNPYVNAQGFPKISMISVSTGAVLNLVLDPIFMFPLGLGVRGAALATILSQTVSAAIVLRFLMSGRAELPLKLYDLKTFRRELPIAGAIVSLGLAAFIMQLTNALVSVFCNRTLSRYGGALFVSIMTVISSVRQILDTPVLAISDGTSPIISFNYGARNARNVKRAMKIMCVLGIIYTTTVWALILIRPSMFLRIFSSDRAVLEQGAAALHIYFFAFIFQTLQYCGQSMFKSLGKKNYAIFFSVFRKVVMVVPLTILLPRVASLGVKGVFMAEPVSNVIGGTACFVTMMLTVMPELREMEKQG